MIVYYNSSCLFIWGMFIQDSNYYNIFKTCSQKRQRQKKYFKKIKSTEGNTVRKI